jgi:lipopolysaccharide transport protein LptA
MAKKNILTARFLKISVAGLFLMILIVISISFITRSQKKLKVPRLSENIVQQKIEKREKVEHFEAEGQFQKHEMKADRHYIGEDDHYHLEGNVRVVLFKKREGKDIFISGDEVVYDKEQIQFIIRGGVEIRHEDLKIEAESLKYNADEERFKSGEGVQFSSQKLGGKAQNLDYSLKEKRLTLWENVSLEFLPEDSSSLPVIIQGDKIDYLKEQKLCILQGNGRLFHGKSRSSADLLKVELFGEEQNIKSLYLKGNAQVYLEDEEEGDRQARMISGDEISLHAFFEQTKIRFIEAAGTCFFKSVSTPEEWTQIEAGTIRFELDAGGRLAAFHAQTEVRMQEKREESGEQRNIDGDVVIFDGERNELQILGNSGTKARIMTESNEILAHELIASLDSDDLKANENVKVVLRSDEEEESVGFFSSNEPVLITAQEMRYFGERERFVFNRGVNIAQKNQALTAEESLFIGKDGLGAYGGVKMSLVDASGESEASGFFAPEQPVFISAREMRFSNESKHFLFYRDVKIWQQKKTLFAELIRLHQESREFVCTGGVRSVIPVVPKDKAEERLEISAERMRFIPEENVISYEENSLLRAQDVSLNAQSVFVYLSGDTGDLLEIIAQGNVIIVKEQTEGRGEKARYDLNNNSIEITGNPVFIDKNKGRTEGDKLTFSISDDRITVENKGRDRSITVIKS